LNNNTGVRAGIIEGMLRGFLDRYSFYDLVLRNKPEALMSLESLEEVNVIHHTALNASRQPRAIDYFGITIVTMAALFGAFLGYYGVAKEKTLKTLTRIYTAPVTQIQFLLGTCLGTFAALIIQLAVVLLTGKYFLNIYYGENIPAVIFLLVCESFFALALGVGVAYLVDNSKAASGILNLIIPVFIFLGGGYMKLPDTRLFEIL
jgi:ABC-2 type transport system permease protein